MELTTRQNFKRIKIFDFLDTLSDAEIRYELLEKCKRYNFSGLSVTVDKNDKRAAYLAFSEHEEADRCLEEIGEFLTVGNSPVIVVPIISKTNFTNSNVSHYKEANVPLRGGRGGVSNYRASFPVRGRGTISKLYVPSFRGRRGWSDRGNFPSSMNERKPPAPNRIERPPNRTLYVGNLNKSTEQIELRRIFERYGFIEDVEIKSTFKGTFAFIKYFNMDMAARAHRAMANSEIRGCFITTGFGESPPSRCLWIGGIGPWTNEGELRREFQQFGNIDIFSWPRRKNYAYVLFQDGESARDAYRDLQGLPFGRDGKRIRVDYVPSQLIDSPLNYKDFEFEVTEREDEDWDFHTGNSHGISRPEFSRSPSSHRRSHGEDHWYDSESERDRTVNEKRSPNSRRRSLSPWKNDDNYNSGRGRGGRGGYESFERGMNNSFRGDYHWERGADRGRRANGLLRRPRGSRGLFGRAGRIGNFAGWNDNEDKRDSGSRERDYEKKGNLNARGRSRGSYHRDETDDRNTRAGHRRDRSSDRDSHRLDNWGSKPQSRSGDRYSGDRNSLNRRPRNGRDQHDHRSSNIESKRRKVHGGSRSRSNDSRSGSYNRKSLARNSETRNRNKSKSMDVKIETNESPIPSASQKSSPTKTVSLGTSAVSERSSLIVPPECLPLTNDVIIIEDIMSGKVSSPNHECSDVLPIRCTSANEQLTSASSTSSVTGPINLPQSVGTTFTSPPSHPRVTEIQLGIATLVSTVVEKPTDNHINRQTGVSSHASHRPSPARSSGPVNGTVVTEGVNAEIARRFPVVWSGALVLKNSAFVTNMYLLSGSVPLVDTLLRDPSSPDCPVLKISQRLRLDDPEKLDELERRIASSGRNGCSVLLAAPAAAQVGDVNNVIQQRSLSSLGVYLHEKECAAVIFLPPAGSAGHDTGVLHAFPPSNFATEFLRKEAPDLVPNYPKDDHLLIIVMRDLTL